MISALPPPAAVKVSVSSPGRRPTRPHRPRRRFRRFGGPKTTAAVSKPVRSSWDH